MRSIVKPAIFCLSTVFSTCAYGASEIEEPFLQIHGRDLTESSLSHDGTAGIFMGTFLSQRFNEMLNRRKKEKDSLSIRMETLMFFNAIDLHIKEKAERLGEPLSRKEIAFEVDAYINDTLTYELDHINYNVGEYFATPHETITSHKGDCEDYAILKYYTLKRLGFSEDNMRFSHSTGHMNLIININGIKYDLDNDNNRSRITVDDPSARKNIKGLLTLNETGRDFLEKKHIKHVLSQQSYNQRNRY